MTLHDELANNLQHNRVTRRQVLWLLGAGAAGITGLSWCNFAGWGPVHPGWG